MIKIGVVILARMSSSRFPGKVLFPINGIHPLQRIVDSLKQTHIGNNFIIATSSDPSDDDIANWCTNNKIMCFRGSLENVARRFYNAAIEARFKFVMRINADNLFISKSLVNEMINYIDEYDFISNVHKRTYPKGLSCEIINVEILEKNLTKIEKSDEFKEHVLLYFYTCKFVKRKFIYNKSSLKREYFDIAFDNIYDVDIIKRIDKELKKNKDILKVVCVN